MPVLLRPFRRSPGLSLAVILMLALGVGALTATFGVVNAALFRQPPFEHAERLALLYLERNPLGEAPRRDRWSFARFELMRRLQRSFDDVASYSPASISISDEGSPEVVQGERVSALYFRVLRARPMLGRVFTETEDNPAAPTHVVVLGQRLWQRRWAGDSAILGRTIRLNGVPLTVIGIMPRSFVGLTGQAELWVPRTMSGEITYAEYTTTNQNFISAVGRLRDESTFDAARGELAILGGDVNRAIPSDPGQPNERVAATAIPLNEARVSGDLRRSLLVLILGVALLHILAWANVTNLLAGRAASRRRESAIRLALGSSPRALFGRLLAENMALASVGGVAGIVLAAALTRAVVPPANVWAPRNFYGSVGAFDVPAFGLAELGFGVVLAFATATLVAVLPALSAVRLDVSSGIRAGSRGLASGGITLRKPNARALIVGGEAAFAVVLLLAAGLLIESFQRMRHANIGVDATNVLTFSIVPSEARVPAPAAPVYVGRLLDAVSRVPGVLAATVDGGAPLAGSANSELYIEGRPTPAPGQAPEVLRHYVGPQHFATLRIPVRRGRVFTAADGRGRPGVAVISETAARRFWPNDDPIGKHVWFGGSAFTSPDSSVEIVGIVGDVAYAPLDRGPNLASVYTPYAQFTYASRTFFLRTARPPMSVVPEVRQAIATVDPELALRDVRPLADVLDASWARHRFDAILFGGFGLAALLLAASGIFAVLSHAVADRTREFGIRIALGADPLAVVRQVLREGMAYPLAGLAAGLGASVAMTRVLQSSLYGISRNDPRVLAAAVAVLITAAVAACLVPAWRAASADPAQALRAE